MTSRYDIAIHRISCKSRQGRYKKHDGSMYRMLRKPHLLRKLAEIWCLDAVEDDEVVRFSGSVCVCCGTRAAALGRAQILQ